MKRRVASNVVTGVGLAMLLAAYGCSTDRSSADRTADANRPGEPAAAGADRAGAPGSAATAGTPGSAATSGTAADENNAQKSVTLTGCLQKGDGRSDYILTELNKPRTGVGTSGTTKPSSSDTVGQEQMRAASHAYKLDGDRDTLEPMVGKEVRVSGTIDRGSALNEHTDSGQLKDRDRTKIDESDLAKVKVASVDSIGDSCRDGAARRR
ncbi:MAG TPA: hypothetical protein VKD69_00890 [Vicinamibacterales bacterium]|nr:hypothetical protein [Vicinamibacterales bacterium]